MEMRRVVLALLASILALFAPQLPSSLPTHNAHTMTQGERHPAVNDDSPISSCSLDIENIQEWEE